MPAFSVTGVVRERSARQPLKGVVVRAHDRDLTGRKPLGEAVTDADGHYVIRFDQRDLRDRERPPDLLLTIVDRAIGGVVHVHPEIVWWEAKRDVVNVDLEIPREQGGAAEPRGLRLLDSHGHAREEFEAGEPLLISAAGLPPDRRHRVRVRDDGGAEVLSAALLADRWGRIEPTVLWPDIGIGQRDGGGAFAFESAEDATAALGGRRFRVELAARGGGAGAEGQWTSAFTIAAALTRTRLAPTDDRGRLRRGLFAGRDDLYISGTNLRAGAMLDLYLVPRQFDWQVGDPLTPATTARGEEAIAHVRLKRDETAFRTQPWIREDLRPGSYDIIGRIVQPREFRAGDRRLRASDLVSDRLVTTLVIRDDIFRFKPIQLGCVMAQREIACRLLSGPPYVRFTNNFPRGTAVWAALDPGGLMPAAVGRKLRFSVTEHKDAVDWDTTSTFTEVPGTGAEIVTTAGCINGNRALVWSNPQTPGRYDLVVDFGNNDPNPASFVADGSFDPPLDMIDGYFTVGFHVTDDPSQPGPFAVGQTSYDEPAVTIPAAGTWSPSELGVVGDTASGTLDLPRRAIVRYPATTAGVDEPVSADQPSYPVVMVSPGQGLPHTGYGYLLDQLASHGFVAVAIDVTEVNYMIVGGGSFDTRAHAALAHLALLKTKHQNPGLFQGKLDFTRILVMGHSRGGDGALATAVFNQALGLGWGIKGVLALAPTDWSGTGPAPLVMPPAIPYLCVHGTADRDIGVFHGAPFSTGFTGLGFRAYDRSAGEKAMVLIRDATHNLFNRDKSNEVTDAGAVFVSRTDHETLLRGYTTAFAQAHLQGRTEQRAYFTGELRIPAVDALEVHHQFRPAASQVRVLDSFQTAPSTGANTLGGTVTPTSLAAPAVEDVMRALDRNAPHQTRGLRLRWNSTAARYASGIPLGGNRNVAGFKTLSFRVSQTFGFLSQVGDGTGYYPHPPPTLSAALDAGTIPQRLRDTLVDYDAVTLGAGATISTLIAGSRWRILDAGTAYRLDKAHLGPFPQNPPSPPYYYDVIVVRLEGPMINPPNLPQDLYVRLATAGGGPARSVRAGYFGPIPFPMRPTTHIDHPLFDEERTLAAMKTIRIPLDAWTIKCLTAPIVDLSNVESVTFELSATGAGELLIDDIEFTP